MKVFGVGGAGCNALAHLAKSSLPGVQCLAINTDAAALQQCEVSAKFALGTRLTRGLGAGGDPERGRAAAEEDREGLSAVCANTDVLFLLAGMGGGTGTGASPVIAQIAQQSGALVLGMVALPFEWEGTRRMRQAQLGLRELKAAADSVVCLPNQSIFTLCAENTSLVESFAQAHDLMAKGVCGLWRLLTQNGLINADFANVCSATRDRHTECALVTAEAQGDARAKELIEKLTRHPLLGSDHALGDASVVLVSLLGGPELTYGEVRTFMEQVNRQCENAHIIFSAAIEESQAGRLSVTLLSGGRRDKAQPPPLAAEEIALPTPDSGLVETSLAARPSSRFVAPPPTITPDNAEVMLKNLSPRARKKAIKMVQHELPLETVSKGRFEKIEPTIRSGQDLDVPTYLRRKLVFN